MRHALTTIVDAELDLDLIIFLGYVLAAAAEMDDPAARGGIYASYCKSIEKLHDR